MSVGRYTVSYSGAVEDQIRASIAAAVAAGDGPRAARAIRRAFAALAKAPSALGESREHLPHANLFLRIMFASRWVVSYGVHEPSRHVFVRRVRWNRRRS